MNDPALIGKEKKPTVPMGPDEILRQLMNNGNISPRIYNQIEEEEKEESCGNDSDNASCANPISIHTIDFWPMQEMLQNPCTQRVENQLAFNVYNKSPKAMNLRNINH